MINKISKYLNVDAPHNVHLKAKLKSCKNIEDVKKVLTKAGWYVSPKVIKAIAHDHDTEEKAKQKVEKRKQEELEKQAQLKKEQEEAWKDNNKARPSKTLPPKRQAELTKN